MHMQNARAGLVADMATGNLGWKNAPGADDRSARVEDKRDGNLDPIVISPRLDV